MQRHRDLDLIDIRHAKQRSTGLHVLPLLDSDLAQQSGKWRSDFRPSNINRCQSSLGSQSQQPSLHLCPSIGEERHHILSFDVQLLVASHLQQRGGDLTLCHRSVFGEQFHSVVLFAGFVEVSPGLFQQSLSILFFLSQPACFGLCLSDTSVRLHQPLLIRVRINREQ